MAAPKRILIAASNTHEGWQRETLRGVREYAEGRRWVLRVELWRWPSST